MTSPVKVPRNKVMEYALNFIIKKSVFFCSVLICYNTYTIKQHKKPYRACYLF